MTDTEWRQACQIMQDFLAVFAGIYAYYLLAPRLWPEVGW